MACRFVLVQHIVLADAGQMHGFRLAVRPDSQQVAAALEHGLVAVFAGTADGDMPLREPGAYTHAAVLSGVRSRACFGCTCFPKGRHCQTDSGQEAGLQLKKGFSRLMYIHWHVCVQ